MSKPNNWKRIARQVSKNLIPHTTSVHNVGVIANCLYMAHQIGFREGVLSKSKPAKKKVKK